MNYRPVQNKMLSIVISLLLSFFLWLALAGQDTSQSELTVPLELGNLPNGLMIKSEVPGSINLQVLANAAQLRFLADRKLNVLIDASSAREGLNAFSVDIDSLDLPRGVQVRRVTPPVIEFEAIKTTNKVVPLKPDTTGAVRQGYLVRAIVLEPDEVIIRGPEEILDGIDSLPTTPIFLNDLNRDTAMTVTPLRSDLPPGLIITPREIKATVTVEEKRLGDSFSDLPIEAYAKGGGRINGLKLIPDRAEVSVTWPASRPQAITAYDLKVQVTIDPEDLAKNTSLNLPLVVVAPSGVAVTGITPGNIRVRGDQPPSSTTPK